MDLHTMRLPDPSVQCLLSAYPYKVCAAGIDKHCSVASEGFGNSERENGKSHVNTSKNRDKSNRTGFCFVFFKNLFHGLRKFCETGASLSLAYVGEKFNKGNLFFHLGKREIKKKMKD